MVPSLELERENYTLWEKRKFISPWLVKPRILYSENLSGRSQCFYELEAMRRKQSCIPNKWQMPFWTGGSSLLVLGVIPGSAYGNIQSWVHLSAFDLGLLLHSTLCYQCCTRFILTSLQSRLKKFASKYHS